MRKANPKRTTKTAGEQMAHALDLAEKAGRERDHQKRAVIHDEMLQTWRDARASWEADARQTLAIITEVLAQTAVRT